jgi:hypothetical protein
MIFRLGLVQPCFYSFVLYVFKLWIGSHVPSICWLLRRRESDSLGAMKVDNGAKGSCIIVSLDSLQLFHLTCRRTSSCFSALNSNKKKMRGPQLNAAECNWIQPASFKDEYESLICSLILLNIYLSFAENYPCAAFIWAFLLNAIIVARDSLACPPGWMVTRAASEY